MFDNKTAKRMTMDEYNEYSKRYLTEDGIPFNPEKFVRKKEVLRCVNAINFEHPEYTKEEFCKELLNELDLLETLKQELDRRKNED